MTVDDVDAWHRQRGFRRLLPVAAGMNPALTAIGYHFVIYLNGATATGRALEEAGAHARGHNHNSIGIALAGRDAFTLYQWRALRETLEALRTRFGDVPVIGHRTLVGARKICPGFDVAAWLANGMAPLDGHVLSLDEPLVVATA